MRLQPLFAAALVATALAASPAAAGDKKPPAATRVVATVNGDAITLGQLLLQIDNPEAAARLLDGRATPDDLALLDRLIIVRLVVQEATTMGIAELPEIQRQVAVMSRSILREVLMGVLVKNVVADAAAVDAAFKELAREWKTTSLLFADEQAAKQTREEIAAGAEFADVAARVVAEGLAKTEGDTEYHTRKEYLGDIADALDKTKAGEITPVTRIGAGFVVVKVLDIRYPESADLRAEARRIANRRKQQAALEAQEEALRAKYVVVHQDVVDTINYEAQEPTLADLLKDTRVVADIKGAPPLTVGDLTEYLKLQFFHGEEDAALARRMSARKQAALDATLMRRVLNVEAARRGIDRTTEYRDKVRAYEDSLIFDSFVQKVIAPDCRMREEEVKGYYEQHPTEFAYPGMVRLRTLAFSKRESAESAIEKLRKGTDFGWLAANADDLVPADARALAIEDGQVLMIDALPDGLQRALAEPKPGDVRLYAHPDGQFYAVVLQDVATRNARPYDEVRDDIARKLYGEKLKTGVEDYAAKLRAAGKVAVHLRKAD